MKQLLMDYMEKRMQDKGIIPVSVRNGPVVTISRDAGCSANLIANILMNKINLKHSSDPSKTWKLINKEIVINAARELNISPEKINYIFKAEEHKLMDEIISALSNRYYKSDYIIRKTIIKGIHAIIDDGYVIIVGRGGVAFTRKHHAALNIKLIAPLEWRIEQVIKKYSVTPEVARKNVADTDRERTLLVDHFFGSPTNLTIFDMIFNVSSFQPAEVAENIYQSLIIKKMI